MAAQKKPRLLRWVALIPLLLTWPLIPHLSAQQKQFQTKDVCPASWYKFDCLGVRLCVSPAMDHFEDEGHGNVAAYIYGAAPEEIRDGVHYGVCIEDYRDVPEEYTHATLQQLSFYVGYYDVVRTPMYAKVERIDDADFSSEESFSRALKRFKDSFNDVESYDQELLHEGQQARKEVLDADAAAAQIPIPHRPNVSSSGRDVCPTDWARYSCQFARLCLSPDLLEKSQQEGEPKGTLERSAEFVFAKCTTDGRTVPLAATHATPYVVGYGAGFRLFDSRKYSKVVSVDSSYIRDDPHNIYANGINAALERAGLSLLPPSAAQGIHSRVARRQ